MLEHFKRAAIVAAVVAGLVAVAFFATLRSTAEFQ